MKLSPSFFSKRTNTYKVILDSLRNIENYNIHIAMCMLIISKWMYEVAAPRR